MHFEAPLEVIGDACVKRFIAAFEDIERPRVRGFFWEGVSSGQGTSSD